MDVLVVKLDGEVIDELEIKGDGDAFGTAVGMGEQAVVVTAAASEACACAGEGEAGYEDDVERGDVDGRAVRSWLPNVHLAALEVVEGADEAWLEALGRDLEEVGADALGKEGREEMGDEVGFVFEAAEEGDGFGGGVFGGGFRVLANAATEDGGGDVGAGVLAGGFLHGTQEGAHGLAQRGFVVHGVRDGCDGNARGVAHALN
jgi:hypothetical protein